MKVGFVWRQWANFGFWMTLLTLLSAASFFVFVGPVVWDVSGLYLLTIPSYFALVWLIVLGLTALLNPVPYLRGLIPLIGALWLLFLVIDWAVYRLYAFHLNLMLIEMAVFDLAGFGLTFGLQAGLMGLLLGFVALIYALWWRGPLWVPKKAWGGLLGGVLAVLLMGQSLHIWAQYNTLSSITRVNGFFPAYYPATAFKTAERLSRDYPRLFPTRQPSDQQDWPTALQQNGQYNNRLTCQGPQKTERVLMLVLESWRADGLTPEVMPFTAQLAQQATQFPRHYAGGNATIPGLFSLMYGLPPSYYGPFRAAPTQHISALSQALMNTGVTSQFWSSTSFKRFDLETLLFGAFEPQHRHYFTQSSPVKADQAVVEAYLADLGQRKAGQAHFDFMFLSSSHFSYHYPAQSSVFTPLAPQSTDYLLSPKMPGESIKNHQRNSFFYLDQLIAQVVAGLKAQGLWESTRLIITGDHGEAFNDYGLGFWGHGSQFSDAQLRVPLIIKTAQGAQTLVPPAEDAISVHQDVAPWLLTDYLGCDLEQTRRITQGEDLNALPATRTFGVSSYMVSAYWMEGWIHSNARAGQVYLSADPTLRREREPHEAKALLERIRQEASAFKN